MYKRFNSMPHPQTLLYVIVERIRAVYAESGRLPSNYVQLTQTNIYTLSWNVSDGIAKGATSIYVSPITKVNGKWG